MELMALTELMVKKVNKVLLAQKAIREIKVIPELKGRKVIKVTKAILVTLEMVTINKGLII
jgi:hypothetical protein